MVENSIGPEELRRMLEKIPRISLLPINIKNCSILLNRQALIERMPPNSVCVELGVDRGDFSRRILKYADPKKLCLVDAWASTSSRERLARVVETRFQAEIASGKVQVFRNNSIAVADFFDESSLDWIYIDTDHSYETTKKELYAYHKKIKPGGYICGHDYCQGNWVRGYKYGVVEAVHEFCVEQFWELIFVTVDFTENQSFAIRKII